MRDGKLESVVADGSESPYGPYMCVKGRSSLEFHQGAEQRLVNSLKRNDEGDFDTINNHQALVEIGSKLSELLNQYGPRSIALYHGTGAYRSVLGGQLEKSFLSALGTPNLFSTMTIDQSAKWVTMGRMGVMASGKPALEDVDLVVIVGNNPVVSHQTVPFVAGHCGAPARSYSDAKKRGTKIIVIDPRRTETARFADLFIQPLPGHDATIFASIAHILLRDNNYNKDFCDRFTIQLEALKQAVAEFTPEFAAKRAGVAAEDIELAAHWLAQAERPSVGSGSGPSMSTHSNLNDHMIEVVNALVGGYRRAGDLVRNPGTLNPRTPVELAVSPTRSWEHGDKLASENIGKLFGEFPTALLPQEILTPGPDKVRALIVFGGNPLMGLGDPQQAIPAFEDLDLLVVLDPRFNETARYAHYVIACSQPFERHDISIPGDALYPQAFAQYAAPVVEKPPGTLHDWEFFWQLAANMGLPLTLKYWSYGLDFENIKEGLELSTQEPPDPEHMLRFLCKNSRVSFEELKAQPAGVRPTLPEQRVLKAAKDNGGRLELCPQDVAAELQEVFQQQPDKSYRFNLICRRLLETMNSAYVDSAVSRKRHPANWAHMNPLDMAELGLKDGDKITLSSDHGSIHAVVKAEKELRHGVVSMAHLFGTLLPAQEVAKTGRAFTGALTSLEQHLQPINYMPRFSAIPVNVKADS